MKLNDYVKFSLAEKKITIKDAAKLLGYAEQSFRNKLSKNNLNLHDLVIISMLIDSPLAFTDKEGMQCYAFDKLDFLSDDDMKRLHSFLIKDQQSEMFDEWFTSLSDKNKQEIYNQYAQI